MQKIKYISTSDTTQVNKLQDAAIRSVNNAKASVQVALFATLCHLEKHHDIGIAQRLVDSIHDGVRGVAIVDYLVRYGHLVVGEVNNDGEKSQGFTGIIGSADEHGAAIRASAEEAKAKLWWTLRPAPSPFKSWSLEDKLQALIKSAEKMQSKAEAGKVDATKVSTEVSDNTMGALLNLCKFDAVEYALAKGAPAVANAA